MSASVQIITDMTTCTTTAPTAATTALAIAAAGPIMDPVGMMQNALVDLQNLKVRLTALKTATDSSDPNYTRISNVLLTLV